MPSYKLTYFNGRGRAEIARMLFVAAGVPYQDDRVEQNEWPALKPKTPLGSMPLLEIDGKTTLIESKAIYRFLAREFNFYGKDNMESTQIDIVTEICLDMWGKLMKAFFMKDETEKVAELTKLFKEDFPNKMAYLEKVLSENDGGKSYFVGNCLSLADITFVQFMESFLFPGQNDNGLDKYPKLKDLKERVCGNEKMAAWLAERPTTPF